LLVAGHPSIHPFLRTQRPTLGRPSQLAHFAQQDTIDQPVNDGEEEKQQRCLGLDGQLPLVFPVLRHHLNAHIVAADGSLAQS